MFLLIEVATNERGYAGWSHRADAYVVPDDVGKRMVESEEIPAAAWNLGTAHSVPLAVANAVEEALR